MKKKLLFFFILTQILRADQYSLKIVLNMSTKAYPAIKTALNETKKYDEELDKTVLYTRALLKSEIIRSMFLSKKVFYLEKIKNNISTASSADMLLLEKNILNSKIGVFNNSLIYGTNKE